MNVKLLINSTIGYDAGLRHLLYSMQRCENKFHDRDIIIVKAGGLKYDSEINDGVTIITADNNSIDFTALIAVNDLDIQATGFLYIHDTCVLGSQFFNNANNMGYGYEMIPLTNGVYSMNIGYYSKNCLKIHEKILSKFKNQSYTHRSLMNSKDNAVRAEDIISNKYKSQIAYQTYGPHVEGPTDFYNTGTPRVTEWYSGLDIYKIKANYYMRPSDDWVINL